MVRAAGVATEWHFSVPPRAAILPRCFSCALRRCLRVDARLRLVRYGCLSEYVRSRGAIVWSPRIPGFGMPSMVPGSTERRAEAAETNAEGRSSGRCTITVTGSNSRGSKAALRSRTAPQGRPGRGRPQATGATHRMTRDGKPEYQGAFRGRSAHPPRAAKPHAIAQK